MKEYHFKYTVTPASYYYDDDKRPDFWIDIRNQHVTIEAENTVDACLKFKEKIHNDWYVSISDTAIKTKQPMYRDRPNAEHQQVGYVFNASTDIEFESYNFKKRNVEVWAEISEVVYPEDFEAEVA